MKTITLIEKYPLIRQSFTSLIKTNFQQLIIQESESVLEYPGLSLINKPDLFMLVTEPLDMKNSLNNIKILKEKYPHSAIILYDLHSNIDTISNYFKLGINGYLSKTAEQDELKECIADVLENKKFIQKDIFMSLLFGDTPARKKDISKSAALKLSPRQIEISNYLCEGHSTSFIAKKLGKKISTISTVKRTIYDKLNVSNIIELKKLLVLLESQD